MHPRRLGDDRKEAFERAQLGIISFGLAVGITAGIFAFVIGMSAGLFGWGWTFVEVMSSLLIGYMPTIVGSITGAVWAFVDGFIAGVIIAFLYNRTLRIRR